MMFLVNEFIFVYSAIYIFLFKRNITFILNDFYKAYISLISLAQFTHGNYTTNKKHCVTKKMG